MRGVSLAAELVAQEGELQRKIVGADARLRLGNVDREAPRQQRAACRAAVLVVGRWWRSEGETEREEEEEEEPLRPP